MLYYIDGKVYVLASGYFWEVLVREIKKGEKRRL